MLTADTAAAGCRGNATMNESVAHSKNNNNNGISDLSLSVAGRDDRQRSTDRSKQRPGLSLTTTATRSSRTRKRALHVYSRASLRLGTCGQCSVRARRCCCNAPAATRQFANEA